MIRAFFLAIGIFVCLAGAQCLFVEKAVFASLGQPPKPADPYAVTAEPPKHELDMPEWAPFALLAGGAVVILYSFTIPRRLRG